MTASGPATGDPAGRVHVEVRPGAYADSVALLQVSRDVAATPGVQAAQVAMATPLNLDLLAQMGFTVPEATANDMVVALALTPNADPDADPDADPGADLDAALAAVETALQAARSGSAGGPGTTVSARSARSAQSAQEPPRTTAEALRRDGADLVLVSVPGEHALVEATDALEAGRDVMVFSDNVPLEQEVALKQYAAARGLLVMGPDCGTALLGGLGLGFANTVRPGPVGVVAASGTGCQQLLALLDAAGLGVGAALGVGGRDLSADVGGLSTHEALRRLEDDPTIERIVLVSKPPDEAVAADLVRRTEAMGTPVHLALLGAGRPDLTAVAAEVVTACGAEVPDWPRWGGPAEAPTGWRLHGLFVGGTLCEEARIILTEALGTDADQHPMTDFGDDAMTAGRAHPMIDPTLRLEQLARVAREEATGVLLLDVVLGHGAEPDPAAALAPALADAVGAAASSGRRLAVVVACVGTVHDPQGLEDQARRLAEAGAEVYLSHSAAARRAVDLIGAAR